jgi:DNA-binding beta-propeller fold protein YncE
MKQKIMVWMSVASVAALVSVSTGAALAHGDAKAMHGGMVQVANDLSFELVVDADGATIYLTDHGKPLATKGITGKLTVLQGTQRVEAEIKGAGDNKLRATGVKLGKGDKLVAVINTATGKTTTVRFTLK